MNALATSAEKKKKKLWRHIFADKKPGRTNGDFPVFVFWAAAAGNASRTSLRDPDSSDWTKTEEEVVVVEDLE